MGHTLSSRWTASPAVARQHRYRNSFRDAISPRGDDTRYGSRVSKKSLNAFAPDAEARWKA